MGVMAAYRRTRTAVGRWLASRERSKWYVLGYPMFWLLAIFLVPLLMLFVFTFYVNIGGGSYRPGFTLENYARLFDVELIAGWPPIEGNIYTQQLWLTVEISLVTAIICLVLGYPLAYYLARMRRPWLRSLLMIVIISSLWVTYVIRAYAWQVILASGGILSGIGTRLGILSEPQSFYPGYWGLVVGMVYVFLPFMVLTVYSSLRNIDGELLEASKNLGAGPLKTFRRITLPLSKNGIVSGTALVFILAMGAYVMPRLLGSSSERTLPVLIENQVIHQQNYPFGAVLSFALILVVVGFLYVMIKLTGVSAAAFGDQGAVQTDGGQPTDRTRGTAGVFGRLGSAVAATGAPRLLRVGWRPIEALILRVSSTTRERIIWVGNRLYLLAVMLFIAGPLVIIIGVSVTPERFLTFPPGGVSSQWYVTFFTDSSWLLSFVNSLTIAAGAAVLATTIGGTLAFALDRYSYRWNALLGTFGVLPILIPPVIVAVAFLVFFLELGLVGSQSSIIIAHGIFYAAFPFILITQGLQELDRSLEEAAMNLGAGRLTTVRTITYPLLRANVFSGALFAFILSLNEYIIAWMLSMFLVDTIPIQIFNSLRYGYSPTIAAASVVYIVLTVVVMVLIDRMTGGIWD